MNKMHESLGVNTVPEITTNALHSAVSLVRGARSDGNPINGIPTVVVLCGLRSIAFTDRNTIQLPDAKIRFVIFEMKSMPELTDDGEWPYYFGHNDTSGQSVVVPYNLSDDMKNMNVANIPANVFIYTL